MMAKCHPVILTLLLVQFGKGMSRRHLAERTCSPLHSMVTLQEMTLTPAHESQPPKKRRLGVGTGEEDDMDGEWAEASMELTEAQKTAELVGRLLAKNKVNSRNAFEVPLVPMGEESEQQGIASDQWWRRLATSLDNNQRIYGYRVDATHSHTYRVLESLAHQQHKEGQFQRDEDEGELGNEGPVLNSLNTGWIMREESHEGLDRFLERNYRNLNVQHIELSFNANPVLVHTKRILDQSGAKALLVNNLPLQTTLALLITVPSQPMPRVMETSEEVFGELIDIVDFGSSDQKVFVRMGEVSLWDREYFHQQEETVKIEEEETLEGLWREMQGNRIRKQRGMNKDGKSLEQSKEQLMPREDQESKPIDVDVERSVGINEQQESIIVDQEGDPLGFNKDEGTLKVPKPLKPEDIADEGKSKQDMVKEREPQQQQDEAKSNSQNAVSKSDSSETVSIPKSSNTSGQISSAISFKHSNTLSVPSDFLTLQTQEEGQTGEDALTRWKNSHSKNIVKKKRERKVRVETTLSIDFNQCLEHKLKRKSVLLLDKVSRKQMKILLKSCNKAGYVDKHRMTGIQSFEFDFRLKTLLKAMFEPDQPQVNSLPDDSREVEAIIELEVPLDRQLRVGGRVCIKKVKARVRELMREREQSSLGEIYEVLNSEGELITPAVCFLTLLHLTNENNWSLRQMEGEYDFDITTVA